VWLGSSVEAHTKAAAKMTFGGLPITPKTQHPRNKAPGYHERCDGPACNHEYQGYSLVKKVVFLNKLEGGNGLVLVIRSQYMLGLPF